ncbi:MAG: type II toxin-antitoxin system VapC family toxin [Planctomycetota bacterium]
MEQKFLIDTNLIIYYFDRSKEKTYSESVIQRIKDLFLSSFTISVISEIEFLGWSGFTPDQKRLAMNLISLSRIIPLDEAIASKTIDIRQRTKIRMPDAIIAATAIVNDLRIATRNTKDFIDIEGLTVYNPFS